MSGVTGTSDRSCQELRNSRAFDVLAGSYDAQINPLLALEERYLQRMLPAIAGLDVLDAGCGSGRWLDKLSLLKPLTLTGIDTSAEMLDVARRKQIPIAQLIQSGCDNIPLADQSVDLILASFVMSYIQDLHRVVGEFDRAARIGCDLFLSDMHPLTQRQLGWKRTFQHMAGNIEFETFTHDLPEVANVFQEFGWKICAAIEPGFGYPEKQFFDAAGRLSNFLQAEGYPAIYILHFRKQAGAPYKRSHKVVPRLRHARIVLGAAEIVDATVEINEGVVSQILAKRSERFASEACEIDLAGYLLMPGLINAHDHLEFALFPRLGNPPYVNASAWAVDIHEAFKELITRNRSVPKDVRLWWGGIRNLLCGVTTVCHHNPHEAELSQEDFPVRVIQNFGWAHSLTFGDDLRADRAATPAGYPFVIHACEGTDQAAMEELWELDRLEILDEDSVLVHALALDDKGVSLLRRHQTSTIICPSSNDYLFGRIPKIPELESIGRIALGSDSPLTAVGDLLDEVCFALSVCHVSPQAAYSMVTAGPAAIFRLHNGEGSIKVSGFADLIAIRERGCDAVERLRSLSAKDVELVMIGGRVQLASPTMLGRIPKSMSKGLEPLWVDGMIRWLRAPVARLLRQAEEILGTSAIHLGGKPIRLPQQEELINAS